MIKMAVIPMDEVKVGDVLVADGGFTCIKEGEHVVVDSDEHGLFVPCSFGKHHLDGQRDTDKNYIGFFRP